VYPNAVVGVTVIAPVGVAVTTIAFLSPSIPFASANVVDVVPSKYVVPVVVDIDVVDTSGLVTIF